MQLQLPDQISLDEGLLSLALGLYVRGRLGLGRAAELARMTRPAFQLAMAKQRLPMDYTLEDLAEDMSVIQARDA
jgi:predicted HTH domain antitoxin